MKTKASRVARAVQGFTILEAAIATIIVGTGIAALTVAAEAGTRANDAGKKLTQATFLAQELREWTLRLPFSDTDEADQDNPPGPDGANPQVFVDDLDDLMAVAYDPPRDGQGSPVADMVGWSQYIDLTWRDPDDLSSVVVDGSTHIIYVEATISIQNSEVLKTGWLITRKD